MRLVHARGRRAAAARGALARRYQRRDDVPAAEASGGAAAEAAAAAEALASALSARWRRRGGGGRAAARRGTGPVLSARRVICAARARKALLRARAVSAFKLPPALSHAVPVLFPSSAGVPGSHGRWRGRLSLRRPILRASAVRTRRKVSDYEQSQATSQSEDSRSDAMVRHRTLSSLL